VLSKISPSNLAGGVPKVSGLLKPKSKSSTPHELSYKENPKTDTAWSQFPRTLNYKEAGELLPPHGSENWQSAPGRAYVGGPDMFGYSKKPYGVPVEVHSSEQIREDRPLQIRRSETNSQRSTRGSAVSFSALSDVESTRDKKIFKEVVKRGLRKVKEKVTNAFHW